MPIQGSNVKFVICTNEQYASLIENDEIDPNAIYFVNDELAALSIEEPSDGQ